MTEQRWQGYTHAELYRLVHEGPGPSEAAASMRRWAELGQALERIDSTLANALNAARAGWQGHASESAAASLRPLGEWARETMWGTETMRSCSELQADLLGRIRAKMPPPVEVTAERPGPVETTLVHLVGGQTDYELQEAKADAAEACAFGVMRDYAEASETNTAALATFEAPPRVVVESSPAQPRSPEPAVRGDITITWGAPAAAGGPRGTAAPGSSRADAARPGGRRASHGHAPGRSAHGSAARNSAKGTGSRDASDRVRGNHAPGRGSARSPESTREISEDTAEHTEAAELRALESSGEAGGLFGEPLTSSRPVIGGDPG